jgi:large subunit ribosomal protein L21
MSYAIVKTGGKQYRVQQGQYLLIERLPDDDGAKIKLEPLLYVDGDTVLDGDDLGKVNIEARILAHERGPKLRIVKFKPKRGYKRRNGHRQELTRIEVTEIKVGAGRSRKAATAEKPEAAAAEKPEAAAEQPVAAEQSAAAEKPVAAEKPPAAEKPVAAEKPADQSSTTPEEAAGNGA